MLTLMIKFADHHAPEMQLYLPIQPGLDAFLGKFEIPDNDVLRCKLTILNLFTSPPNPIEELKNVIAERSMTEYVSSYDFYVKNI